jgi:2-polyprenyl-3-methyl-5-hydroxy-6-metoxy-1,4-benzoquinol methylase
LVIAYHVIEHLKNPTLFIKKIKKLMSKGSYLIIGTPDFDSSMSRLFKNNYRMLHDKTHISLFSSESITRLLVDSKFLVKKFDYPFFDTTYFTKKNLLRMFDRNKISPPFYGNFMTIVAKKN